MRENIVERLTRGGLILLDGGTGSELQRRGVEVLHGSGETRRLAAWSALANVEAADVVRQVHTDYLRVGADAIISNSFWTGPTRMASVGLADDWERYARAAGENAVAARDAANPDAYVFGGIAPPAISSGARAADPIGRDRPWARRPSAKSTATRPGSLAELRSRRHPRRVRRLHRRGGSLRRRVRRNGPAGAPGHPPHPGRRHDAVRRAPGGPGGGAAGQPRRRHHADVHRARAHLRRAPRLIDAYDGPVGGYPNIGYMPLAPVDPDKPTMTNQLPSISGDFLQTADYYPTRLAAFARRVEGDGGADHRRLLRHRPRARHGHGAGRQAAALMFRRPLQAR